MGRVQTDGLAVSPFFFSPRVPVHFWSRLELAWYSDRLRVSMGGDGVSAYSGSRICWAVHLDLVHLNGGDRVEKLADAVCIVRGESTPVPLHAALLKFIRGEQRRPQVPERLQVPLRSRAVPVLDGIRPLAEFRNSLVGEHGILVARGRIERLFTRGILQQVISQSSARTADLTQPNGLHRGQHHFGNGPWS